MDQLGDQWSPEDIRDALPADSLREGFDRQLAAVEVSERPQVLARWTDMVQTLRAAAERGREVHAYQVEHGGELPPDFHGVAMQSAA